jgi:hypothetical protein
MINEHDMTRKMLNLIREATNGLDPIENQVPVPQNSLTPPAAEEPTQEQPQQTSTGEDKGGPVSNITISGELPSGVQFTMNYRENVGVQIVIPEQITLEKEVVEDLSQLLGLEKPFRDKWNERGANTNLGKKQINIYQVVSEEDENGNTVTKQVYGPDNSKAWYDEDIMLFNPVSDQITFTSYIVNP